MKSTATFLKIAAAFALAAFVFAIASPRAVHAVVSALVTVTNTVANPVLSRDVDHPANEPFFFEKSAFGGNNAPIFATFVVPTTTPDGASVKRLVIEEVSTECSNVSSLAAGIRFDTQNGGREWFFPFPVSPDPANQVLASTTRIYADPGDTVGFNTLSFVNFGVCSFTASGHFVTQ